jgi:hypothetical protein
MKPVEIMRATKDKPPASALISARATARGFMENQRCRKNLAIARFLRRLAQG